MNNITDTANLADISLGRCNYERLAELAIKGGASDTKDPVTAFIQQLVENAVDAHARRMWLLYKRGVSLDFLDDGDSLGMDNIHRLNSFSPQGGKEPGKGFGMHGSGRLFGLAFAGLLRYYFRSRDFPRLMYLEFRRGDLVKLMSGGKLENPPRPVKDVPEFWEKHIGDGFGTAVQVLEIDWAKMPKRDTTIGNRLQYVLGPWDAPLVQINGNALPPLYTEGKLEWSDDHPLLGRINHIYYHLSNPDPEKDRIRLGRNALSTIKSFVSGSPLELYRATLKPWFLGATVTGWQDIEWCKQFAGVDRRSLQSEVHQDEKRCKALFVYWRDVVIPRLETHYGLQESAVVQEENENELQLVSELLPPRDGPVVDIDGSEIVVNPPPPPQPEPPIILTPQKEEVVCGGEVCGKVKKGPRPRGLQDFEVIPPDRGVIDYVRGREWRFRAGDIPGKVQVVYHHPKDLSVTGVSEIELYVNRKFGLSRRFMEIAPRQTKENFVENYDGDTVTATTECPFLLLEVTGKTVKVTVVEGCLEGYYYYDVRGDKAGEHVRGTIRVPRMTANVLEIDGDIYELQQSTAHSPVVELDRDVILDERPSSGRVKIGVVRINFQAPVLAEAMQQAGVRGKLLVLFKHIAAVHCHKKYGDGALKHLERVTLETLKVVGLQWKKRGKAAA
ncbi:MAG: hypothetical protein Greene041619_980 [Candidatus Peregrinibacteria bacterium Greene0416_19]|nr:MAG: hypothetical protein Greene041619_980 [Candidatus Peregrinibacteria bacterium Greene0416_19]